jgi:hypothetical protein
MHQYCILTRQLYFCFHIYSLGFHWRKERPSFESFPPRSRRHRTLAICAYP